MSFLSIYLYICIYIYIYIYIYICRGVATTVTIAHNQLLISGSTSPESSGCACVPPANPSPIRMSFLLLSVLNQHSIDLYSYLSFALNSSITHAGDGRVTETYSEKSIHVVDSVTLLDDCVEILGALLLLPQV
jgi:hypothetical protein